MAAKGLGQKIDNMVREQRKVAEVRGFLEQIYNKTGEVMIQETYKSHYKQLPAYIRVGRSEGDPRAGRVIKVRVNND